MIAAVLSTQFNVQKTFANFNNEIGVPMTILSMEPNTEILVVEMGMDRFGQLDELSRWPTRRGCDHDDRGSPYRIFRYA